MYSYNDFRFVYLFLFLQKRLLSLVCNLHWHDQVVKDHWNMSSLVLSITDTSDADLPLDATIILIRSDVPTPSVSALDTFLALLVELSIPVPSVVFLTVFLLFLFYLLLFAVLRFHFL